MVLYGQQFPGWYSKLPYLGMKFDHWQSSRSCTYTLFLLQGLELILVLYTAVFENGLIWAWHLTMDEHSRGCTYAVFLPQWGEIEFSVAVWAVVSAIKAIFQNCHNCIINMTIGKSSRSCTYPSYVKGTKLSLFVLYRQQFTRYRLIFKIARFGHETWPLTKVPEVAYTVTFYPRGSKLSSFSLYRQWLRACSSF